MKIDMTDEELKEFFGKMRLEDEGGTPRFEQVVSRSVTVVRSFSPVWRFVAAMGLVILFGAVIFLVSRPQTDSSIESAYENWSAMSNWKATTDNMPALTAVRIDRTLTTATDALLETVYESGSVTD